MQRRRFMIVIAMVGMLCAAWASSGVREYRYSPVAGTTDVSQLVASLGTDNVNDSLDMDDLKEDLKTEDEARRPDLWNRAGIVY